MLNHDDRWRYLISGTKSFRLYRILFSDKYKLDFSEKLASGDNSIVHDLIEFFVPASK